MKLKLLPIVALLLTSAVFGAEPPNCNLMKRDETALACAIYYEARGASKIDQLAVSYITINRSKLYNKRLVSIVKQKGQYTFMKRKDLVPKELVAWEHSKSLARRMILLSKNPVLYKSLDFTQGATYYHDRTISNPWNFTKTFKTAKLVLYRDDKYESSY